MTIKNIFWLALIALSITAFVNPVSLTLNGGDGCPRPGDIEVSGIADTSAVVTWILAGDVDSAIVEVRQSGSMDWSTSTAVESPFTLDTLKPCTTYDVRMFSMCDGAAGPVSQISSFVTDTCCRIPSSLHQMMVDDTFAIVAWDDAAAVDTFVVRYKPLSSNTWKFISTTGTGIVLIQLKSCTAYEVQVQGICGPADTTGYSGSLYLFTTGCGSCTGSDYCQSRGIDAQDFWIDSISFGNFFMPSGSNGGYLAYTAEKLILERGRTYDLFVAPGFGADTCPQILRAWLDLDLDGIFNDSTELVMDSIDMTGLGVKSMVSLSDTLDLDFARLRVSLTPWADGDTVRTSPCDVFDFGEVEDYCIKIDDVCPIAENLDTVSVGETSATINWDVNDKALGFYYQYREVGNNEWEGPEIIMDTVVQLSGLKKCKKYEFELIQVCIQDTTHQLLRFDTKCSSATRDISLDLSTWKVYPNPFVGDFTVEVESRQDFDGYLQVVTSSGTVLLQQRLELNAGLLSRESYNILSDAPAGLYFIILSDGKRISAARLVKAN